MSDTSQGQGWWQASDGKWYPPESYPTDWTPTTSEAAAETASDVGEEVEAAAAIVDDVASDTAEETVGEATEAVAAVVPEIADEPVGTDDVAVAAAVAEIADAAPIEEATAAVAEVAPPAVDVSAAIDALPGAEEPPPVPAPPAAPPMPAAPPAAVDPALDATQHIPTVDATMVHQEVPSGWVDPAAAPGVPPAPGAPATPGNLPPAAAVASGTKSNAIPAAIAGLLGGGAMVASPFLDWALPVEDAAADVKGQLADLGVANLAVPTLNGFDSNGIGVLIAGVVAALCGVLLLAGMRHVMIKAGMVLAGLAGVALFAFSFIDIGDLPITINSTKLEGITFDPQIGLWVAVAGGVVATIGGLIAKSD